MTEAAPLSWSLLAAAGGVGVVHTLLGPDHYLPFIMLARARRWSRLRTAVVTAVCGLGHVVSSVALGGIGIALGLAIGQVESLESGRGPIAAWALVAFGLAYALWGLRHALRRRAGLAAHSHGGEPHLHSHGASPHAHGTEAPGAGTSFWALFIVFVLGPCEPLIPLFALPASQGRWDAAALTALVFGAATLASMLGATLAGVEGLKMLRLAALERWSHVVAGAVIAAAGLSVIYLGL
ncbi:MAG: sulfite exporter TauE/SafE family protein [Thermoanaerobaculales bacterium]|jgi:sulfite exporter TauE/SafE|nr:sulfite exporter TauE/SafE family protein [Thermoanaerobaculales bacterium]